MTCCHLCRDNTTVADDRAFIIITQGEHETNTNYYGDSSVLYVSIFILFLHVIQNR